MYYEECTIEEIKAYRNLESEQFDFGNGLMKIEGGYGSEDAYYEMDIQEYQEKYNTYQLECNKLNQKHTRYKNKHYYNKKINKIKILKLKKYNKWYLYRDDKGFLQRTYYTKSKIKKYFKKLSNKRIRQYKGSIQKGNNYKKLYDLEYNIE